MYIAPDYIISSDAEQIYNNTKVKNIVVVDPLFSFDKNIKLRSNIAEVIESKYQVDKSDNSKNISWTDF